MADPPTPAIFALLLALFDGRRHGYALISDVEELTEGHIRLGPGTLYRSLQRMRLDGLIEEIADDSGDEVVTDRRAERRRSYQITDAGRQVAAAEAARLAVFVQAARYRGLPTEPKEGLDDRQPGSR